MFRGICIVMLIVILLSIAVQYNDADGWIWMLIYAVGIVPTVAAIARTWTGLSVIVAIGYYAGFFYLLPSESVESPSSLITDLQMHEAGVEETREAIGLLICAVWMTVLGVIWWRNRNRKLVK
jgi:uncharacterized membrane protein